MRSCDCGKARSDCCKTRHCKKIGGNTRWPVLEAAWPQNDRVGLLDKARIIAPTRAIIAGWSRPPRSPSISASAWLTASACSGCRSAAPSACPRARQGNPLPGRRHHLLRQGRHHRPRPVCHRLRLDPVRSRLDVHAVLRAARRLRRHLGRLARARRPAQSRRRRGVLLVRRPDDLGVRRLYPPALADVARLRHHRRRAASGSAISRPSRP